MRLYKLGVKSRVFRIRNEHNIYLEYFRQNGFILGQNISKSSHLFLLQTATIARPAHIKLHFMSAPEYSNNGKPKSPATHTVCICQRYQTPAIYPDAFPYVNVPISFLSHF